MNRKKSFMRGAAILLAAVLCGCSAITGNSGSSKPAAEADTSAKTEIPETVRPVEAPAEDEEHAAEQEAFAKFLKEYVIEEASSDYSTMHWAYADPEAAGIDRENVEVTLGPLESDHEESAQQVEWIRSSLAEYDYDLLSDAQQDIYEHLIFTADLAEKRNDEKFDYLDNIWSSSDGIHQQLISCFSEYFLYEEQDVKDLVVLIEDVPRIAEEAIEYTKKQADADLLYIDYDTVMESLEEVISAQENSAVTAALYESIDELGLEAKSAAAYKQQVKEAMDACFYPSFEMMKEELAKLKGKVHEPVSISTLPNGQEYYLLKLQKSIGSADDIETIRTLLQDAAADAYMDLMNLLMNHKDLQELDPTDLQTKYSDIVNILKNNASDYRKNFPEVGEMVYNLDGIEDERAGDFSAYFVIPTIDSKYAYRICYNKKSVGDDAGTLDMFQTISHEGIPGHMYQTQFDHENLIYDISFFNTHLGFTEGWATYASTIALEYLSLPRGYKIQYYIDYMNFLNLLSAMMELNISYDGWTREEFTKYYSDMIDEEALGDIYTHLAENRIYYMPYFYGYAKILEIRTEAEEALGDAFDEVEFHRALLSAGSTDFGVIEGNVKAYIKSVKNGKK